MWCTTYVCNDNGIAENLPLNRMLGDYDIIHGTFFVCGLTSNDFTDLTPQQMKRYEELYHDPQLFFLLGKTLYVEHTTPEEYTRVMLRRPKQKIPGAMESVSKGSGGKAVLYLLTILL